MSGLVEQTVEGGTGASRQREAFAGSEHLEDVVDFVVDETLGAPEPGGQPIVNGATSERVGTFRTSLHLS